MPGEIVGTIPANALAKYKSERKVFKWNETSVSFSTTPSAFAEKDLYGRSD